MKKQPRFETLIAFGALIIAALSLVISSVQTSKTYELTRKHNKLSVIPHLDILKHQAKHMPKGLSVVNNGIGPARIIKFEVLLDGRKMPDVYAWWEPILERMNQEFGDWKGLITFGRLRKGQYLRDGDEVFLLREPAIDTSNNAQVVFMSLCNRLGFKIEYESIYKDTFDVIRIQNK